MKNNIGETYYNEEQKKRYIKNKQKVLSVPITYIDVLFRKSYEYESELDKDLSNWTSYEIIEFYKLLNVSVLESLIQINSICSNYTQFCLENNLVKDNQNHYLECTRDIMKGCVNKAVLDKKIVDRETVVKWVNELPNPKDQFILLSLFEYGKSKDFKDIVNAKPENLNGNVLELFDRKVVISSELKRIIANCVSEDKYYSMTGKAEKVIPLNDYGYIIKSYPNQNIDASDFQKGRNIYIACQRIFDYLGIREWMSPNYIAESGRLHMIKSRAEELNITSLEYIYSDKIKEVEQQYNTPVSRSVYVRKYEAYLNT